ncbi:CDP-alcohol phosphatidyltransferase family protein [Sphingomonas sp.]|uniref:CDP-alcohol phosphatidyltransferase family protein n=1 Tax=Sphingomonas sp. TaxID=28214 RepID=UPI003B3A25CC
MNENSPPQPNSVERVQRNMLAALERRLLNFLCRQLPPWVTPDTLTGFGMAGSLAIFAGYVGSNVSPAWLWLTLAGFVIQWFGDSLDGSLARYRHIERPSYGYFVDHSCDGLTTLLILGGMGLSPYVRLDVALIALAGYLLLSVHAFLYARVGGQLKLTFLAAGPTELRFVLIGLTAAMMLLGASPGLFGKVSGFDLFVGTIGSILILLFVVHTMGTARDLAKVDRRP